MRFKRETEEEKIKRLTTWKKKFAWIPTKVNDDLICWLEFYERRKEPKTLSNGEIYGCYRNWERRLRVKPENVNWHVQEQETSRARS